MYTIIHMHKGNQLLSRTLNTAHDICSSYPPQWPLSRQNGNPISRYNNINRFLQRISGFSYRFANIHLRPFVLNQNHTYPRYSNPNMQVNANYIQQAYELPTGTQQFGQYSEQIPEDSQYGVVSVKS